MRLLSLLVDDECYFYYKIPRGLLLEHAPPTHVATIEKLFSCIWCASFAFFYYVSKTFTQEYHVLLEGHNIWSQTSDAVG
jgi:hypothetical protein